MGENQIDDILRHQFVPKINGGSGEARVSTMSKTPALRKTFAAIARFLLVTWVVHAIRNDIVTTREKQKPITIACGIKVLFDNLKKKLAWTIPRARYTANRTAAAGTSNRQLQFAWKPTSCICGNSTCGICRSEWRTHCDIFGFSSR